MVEPLGNWETGIMSTPDFAKPWFMKIRGYSSNSHNMILFYCTFPIKQS